MARVSSDVKQFGCLIKAGDVYCMSLYSHPDSLQVGVGGGVYCMSLYSHPDSLQVGGRREVHTQQVVRLQQVWHAI